MRIAIIELDYHFVDLYNFCKLFEFSEHQITVFTNKDIYKRFIGDTISPTYKWVVKEEEKLSQFLNRNSSLLNSHDLIFFNTIASGYEDILKAKFIPPTIFRIHNANSYLKPLMHIHIPKNLFELSKSVSYIFREMLPNMDFLLIPKLIKKMSFVSFTDYFVEDYVIENKLIRKEKIFPCIPSSTCFSVNKEISAVKLNLDICIPGAIDERKRNYIEVSKAIKEAIPYLQNKIIITLVGKPVGKYGKNVIKAFKDLENDKFQFKYFQNFVSQHDYNSILQQADMIIAPVVKESSFRIYNETYGKSKTSGSFLELVRYGKLTIFPEYFSTSIPLSHLLDKYKSTQTLAKYLVEYANKRDHLIKRTYELQEYIIEKYSPVKIIKEFENNCKNLL